MTSSTSTRPRYTRPFNEKSVLWLSPKQCHRIAEQYGTPALVYNEPTLAEATTEMLQLPHAYGLTARYAVKANINSTLITFLNRQGIQFDASSHWEVKRLLHYGVLGSKILLTAQEKAPDPISLLKKGVLLNATSLHQFHAYSRALQKLGKSKSLSIRINPGSTSSVPYKTNVAGSDSSFGIWHESIPQLVADAKKYGLRIERLHVHLSSNTNPEEWLSLIEEVLNKLVPLLADVCIFNVGGGFAVARYPGEHHTKLTSLFTQVKKLIVRFAQTHRRKLHLELEPGGYLLARAGILIGKVDDITTTPKSSKKPNKTSLKKIKTPLASSDEQVFVKLNTGMNDLMRPSLYGTTHYMAVVRHQSALSTGITGSAFAQKVSVGARTPVIIVGHCCEKGDLLTPEVRNPYAAKPQLLGKITLGDYILITGVGAYGQTLSNHYNSFPTLAECWLDTKQQTHLIRKRETLSDLVRSEINIFKNSPIKK